MQFIRIFMIAALAGPGTQSGQSAADALPAEARFEIRNTGVSPLTCGAALAHWFSEEIGGVAPGQSLSFAFGYDLPSGTLFRLNDRGDEMAVERVWCGEEGRVQESRAQISLPRSAGIAPEPVRLNCAAVAGRVSCTPQTAE